MAEMDYLGENEKESEVNEHGVETATTHNVVNEDDATLVTDHDLAVVEHNREVLKAEAEGIEGTEGPADNFTGSHSDDANDHIFSTDPWKKAFPPGPWDPSKA